MSKSSLKNQQTERLLLLKSGSHNVGSYKGRFSLSGGCRACKDRSSLQYQTVILLFCCRALQEVYLIGREPSLGCCLLLPFMK